MPVRRAATILLLILRGAMPALSQETEPPWLVAERAERLLAEREFGLAIQSFRHALQLSPRDPDVLFGLGRAYKAIGDQTVALDYFARALDHRGEFDVPDTALLVRYERAEVYRARRDFARYESELFEIVADDPVPEDALPPDDIHLDLEARGLDRLLVLYRLPESGSTRARGMLAELLVGLGRYAGAAEQGAIAVLQSFTTLIDAALQRDPTYEFTTVADLWERIARLPEVERYLETSALPHDLYYLAAAYWGEGNSTALEVWRTLARIDADGRFGARALRQLDDPTVEPLIVPAREP
ncbi:MAG: tetratricopeptide repeat protein [Spirochaetota bacterium]